MAEMFETIIGQTGPKNVLSKAFKNGRLAHAYLFYGHVGVGKEAMALALAKAIVCEDPGEKPCNKCSSCHKMNSLAHPDIMFIFAAPLSVKVEDERIVLQSVIQNPYWRHQPWANPVISINKIREIRHSSSLKSFEGHGRVVIIAECEKLTAQASNALLKILEEPPPNTTLLLTSAKQNLLLPTIVSRCQLIRFELLKADEIENALAMRENVPAEKAKLIARVANGSYRQALELQDEDLNGRRDLILDILRVVIQGDLERIQKVEEIVRSADKRMVKEYIKLLLLWFRDILLLLQFTNDNSVEAKLVNYDRREILNKFLTAFEEIDFERAISALEKALQNLDRNIHLGLILTVLFQHLHVALRRKQ